MSQSLHPIEVVDITAERKKEEKNNTLLMSYTDITD